MGIAAGLEEPPLDLTKIESFRAKPWLRLAVPSVLRPTRERGDVERGMEERRREEARSWSHGSVISPV